MSAVGHLKERCRLWGRRDAASIESETTCSISSTAWLNSHRGREAGGTGKERPKRIEARADRHREILKTMMAEIAD